MIYVIHGNKITFIVIVIVIVIYTMIRSNWNMWPIIVSNYGNFSETLEHKFRMRSAVKFRFDIISSPFE